MEIKSQATLTSREACFLPEFKLIPAGEFEMGFEDGMPDERPLHTVWVDEFEIAAIPVTNREYEQYLRDIRSESVPSEWKNPLFNGPLQPVVSVTWLEAAGYCSWLSGMMGQKYRLPTEAEREKAARGGKRDLKYPWGDDIPPDRPVKSNRHSKPDVVGVYPPNGYGLFDIEGNVHEWCLDWYDPVYYARSPYRNPQGPGGGDRRASRGGSWRHHINITRSSARSSLPPDKRYNDYGFRLVRGGTFP